MADMADTDTDTDTDTGKYLPPCIHQNETHCFAPIAEHWSADQRQSAPGAA
jgi:hypothetical protein